MPSCEVYIFDEIPYLYAMQEIPAGAELTFGYKLQSARSQRISRALGRELFPCHCGAPTCRGTLVAPSKRRAKSARTAPTPPPSPLG